MDPVKCMSSVMTDLFLQEPFFYVPREHCAINARLDFIYNEQGFYKQGFE